MPNPQEALALLAGLRQLNPMQQVLPLLEAQRGMNADNRADRFADSQIAESQMRLANGPIGIQQQQHANQLDQQKLAQAARHHEQTLGFQQDDLTFRRGLAKQKELMAMAAFVQEVKRQEVLQGRALAQTELDQLRIRMFYESGVFGNGQPQAAPQVDPRAAEVGDYLNSLNQQ
jgi:hypothetical protein